MRPSSRCSTTASRPWPSLPSPRATAGAGGAPTLENAIRSAIKSTSGLQSYTVDDPVLDNAAALAVQKQAIIKHNELTLSRVIDRVLDDKQLLEQFIAANDYPGQLAILNDPKNKLKFAIGLCVADTTNPNNPFVRDVNLSDTALDKVKQSAEAKVRELANPAALDRRELRQRLNVAIAEGQTKYGYECKHVTDPAEIQQALAGTMKAAAAGGAAVTSDSKRTEESVKANDLTTWVKSAATQTAGTQLDVTVVREPNGTMKTTNTAAQLATLTTNEKIDLAKQMAQEYIANMMEGKEIYITCGDEELGNKLYASLLAIQMEAKKACSNPDNKSLAPIANAQIFPPTGIESLSNSWDMTKEKFIKKHLGATQEQLAVSMAKPAMVSYIVTAKKLETYDTAQEQLSKKTKELDEAGNSKRSFRHPTAKGFQDYKDNLKTAKEAAETAADKAKADALTSEVDREGKPRPK